MFQIFFQQFDIDQNHAYFRISYYEEKREPQFKS